MRTFKKKPRPARLGSLFLLSSLQLLVKLNLLHAFYVVEPDLCFLIVWSLLVIRYGVSLFDKPVWFDGVRQALILRPKHEKACVQFSDFYVVVF